MGRTNRCSLPMFLEVALKLKAGDDEATRVETRKEKKKTNSCKLEEMKNMFSLSKKQEKNVNKHCVTLEIHHHRASRITLDT